MATYLEKVGFGPPGRWKSHFHQGDAAYFSLQLSSLIEAVILIKRFGQLAQLVAALDLHAVREVHGLQHTGCPVLDQRTALVILRVSTIPVANAASFDEQEDNFLPGKNRLDRSPRSSPSEVKIRAFNREGRALEAAKTGSHRLHAAIAPDIDRVEPGYHVDRDLSIHNIGILQCPVTRHDTPRGNILCVPRLI